jgi:hypothetical protein
MIFDVDQERVVALGLRIRCAEHGFAAERRPAVIAGVILSLADSQAAKGVALDTIFAGLETVGIHRVTLQQQAALNVGLLRYFFISNILLPTIRG